MRLKRATLLFILIVLPSFLYVQPVRSTSSTAVGVTKLTLEPIEDAHVYSNSPDSNFGSSSNLYVEFRDYKYTSDVRYNSYLKFDLSSVPIGAKIVYAKLELYCWYTYNTSNVGVHYCEDNSWNETGITWNNAPSFMSNPTYTVTVTDEDQWYAWNITNDVKGALDNGILTVVLKIQNIGGSFNAYFYSKEGWKDNPRLVIEYTDTGIAKLSLEPLGDAHVSKDKPDSNFGNSSYLDLEFWSYSDARENAYLKFDLSDVPTGVNIVYAKLELYCWYVYNAPNVGAHYCPTDSWGENEITWNNAPLFAATPTAVIKVLDDDQWYVWDVTSNVKTALDDRILTLVLKVADTTGSFSISFYSKENRGDHPRLVIGYATQILCSASPLVVTLGGSVTVSGCIPLIRSESIKLTYTKPDTSTIVTSVMANSEGSFTHVYTPDTAGVWSVTAAWGGAEGYDASSTTAPFIVTENARNNWAIIIGITNYKDIDDLWYPHQDALELYDKLREIWPEDRIKLLVNEEATKVNIESAIKDWLAPRETSDSVVLFFFSGHGCRGPDVAPNDETDGKDEYICPYDSLTTSYNNDIRDDTLDDWLNNLDSRHISVFLDSCYSGGFIDKANGKDTIPTGPGDGFAKDLSKDGRVIITASNETESSWEYKALKHGVFAYYILEGFDNLGLLDDEGNNEISAEEFFAYIEFRVISYTEGEQHPQIDDKYSGELTLMMTVNITLDTFPCKTSITVDGSTYFTPKSFVWPYYTQHAISVSRAVSSGLGTRYRFASWSDGNNLTSRTLVASEFALTDYTANFGTQYYLTIRSAYGDPQGGGWHDVGAVASFSVTSPFDHGNGTRRLFTGWSGDVNTTSLSATLIMNAPKLVSAQWKTQYYLTINVNPSGILALSGEGWYDRGTEVLTESAQTTVSGGVGIRYFFEVWKVDNVIKIGNPVSILMDSPHSALAQYKTQYHLTIQSPYGDPKGEDWYDADSTATISVTSPYSFIIQRIFTGWSGDLASSSTTATILMDGPKTVVASWRDEYTQLYILLAVIAVIVLVIAVKKRS